MASGTRVIIGQETMDKALASPALLKAVEERAQRQLPKAQRIAVQAGRPMFAAGLRVESGRRPGTKSPYGFKRPYARVIGPNDEGTAVRDSRTASLSPTKILRRSARG